MDACKTDCVHYGERTCCLRYKPNSNVCKNYYVDTKRRGSVPKKLTIEGIPGDKVYFITEASKAGTKTSLVVCSDEIRKIDVEKEIVYHFTGGNDVTGDMVFLNIKDAVETIERKLTEDSSIRRIDMS